MRKRYVVFGLTAVLAISLTVPALGGPGNPIATVAGSAKSTAKKALKKAKKANQAAQAAQSTADGAASAAGDAQQSANQAQNAADGAQTAAEAAQTTADGAATAAAAAQATADSKFGDVTYADGATVGPNVTANKLGASACPGGDSETPIAGGWTFLGAGANNATTYNNSAYLNGWLVQAQIIEGTPADSWSLTARVVCISQT
jgi:hypothetical protein